MDPVSPVISRGQVGALYTFEITLVKTIYFRRFAGGSYNSIYNDRPGGPSCRYVNHVFIAGWQGGPSRWQHSIIPMLVWSFWRNFALKIVHCSGWRNNDLEQALFLLINPWFSRHYFFRWRVDFALKKDHHFPLFQRKTSLQPRFFHLRPGTTTTHSPSSPVNNDAEGVTTVYRKELVECKVTTSEQVGFKCCWNSARNVTFLGIVSSRDLLKKGWNGDLQCLGIKRVTLLESPGVGCFPNSNSFLGS